MKPQSHEEHIRHTFDAFCKKVLRNEARDYLDEIARKRSREISLSELPVEVMEQLAVYDRYFAEIARFTFWAAPSMWTARNSHRRLPRCQRTSRRLFCCSISLKCPIMKSQGD